MGSSYPLLYGLAGGEAREPIVRLTNGQISGGTLAVACFFIISGYLIAKSWERDRNLGAFLRRRARRIYPGFAIASLISAFAVPLLARLPLHQIADGEQVFLSALRIVLLNGPYVPGLFASAPVPNTPNGSLWTIQYEWWCYVLVAALGFVGMLRRALPLYLGAIAMVVAQWAGVLSLEDRLGPSFVLLFGLPEHYPALLAAFLGGVICYRYPPRSWGVAALAALALLATARYGGLQVAMPLVGPYLLLRVGLTPVSISPWPSHWPDLSYGIYLYAFPIQQLIVQWAGDRLEPTVLSALALALVCPVALASWYAVERPFLRGWSPAPIARRIILSLRRSAACTSLRWPFPRSS